MDGGGLTHIFNYLFSISLPRSLSQTPHLTRLIGVTAIDSSFGSRNDLQMA